MVVRRTTASVCFVVQRRFWLSRRTDNRNFEPCLGTTNKINDRPNYNFKYNNTCKNYNNDNNILMVTPPCFCFLLLMINGLIETFFHPPEQQVRIYFSPGPYPKGVSHPQSSDTVKSFFFFFFFVTFRRANFQGVNFLAKFVKKKMKGCILKNIQRERVRFSITLVRH